MTYIHPLACVDVGAQIEAGTTIWHFTHVMAGARIGKNCMLGQNVFVADGVVIGDRCRIQNNVSLYRGVTLAEDVFVGPSCVFTNVKNPRVYRNQHDAFAPITVGKGATLGANATILPGLHIGDYALVGAGAVVTHSVPNYALVVGSPARQTGWVGRYGVALDATLTCPETGEQYILDPCGLKLA